MKKTQAPFPSMLKINSPRPQWKLTARHQRHIASTRDAFSLIELLVVLAIIALLAILLIPSFRGISSATNMTRASEDISGLVSLASQRASAFNRQTSIRFLRQGKSGVFVAYQFWEQRDSADPNSWQAVDPIRILPPDVGISDNATYSSLLTRYSTGTMNASTGSVWNYAEALFAPEGSLVASTGQTSITLIGRNSSSTSSTLVPGLPPNFAVVDIDPLHSIPRIYRP